MADKDLPVAAPVTRPEPEPHAPPVPALLFLLLLRHLYVTI